MKIRIVLFVSLLVVLTSCNVHHVSEFVEFDDNRWAGPKEFEFEIAQAAKSNIIFRFSHIYDYQLASVPLQFVIEKPDGSSETLAVDLAIKDDKGNELGDCSGDICDLEYPLKQNTQLAKGKYKVTISHNFKDAPYLPNVIGIGLYVDSVK